MKQLVEQYIDNLREQVNSLLEQEAVAAYNQTQVMLLTKLQLITELEKYKYTVMSDEEKQQLMQSLCSYDSVVVSSDKYTKVELTDTTITKLANAIREVL